MAQPETGDPERVKAPRMQERLAAMAEVERVKALDIWPTSCETCFAQPGERCITKTGGRAMRHVGRKIEGGR